MERSQPGPLERDDAAIPGRAKGTPSKAVFSGKKRAHKLKKNARDTGRVSLGHPAGQTGVYRPVSGQGLPVIYYRRTARKGIFAGMPAGCLTNFM